MAAAQIAPKLDRVSTRHVDARNHRLRTGVSIESICERTKISRYFLEAIEERAYHRLPGGIFDVSYIRQYAEQIGYSAESLLEDYRARKGSRDVAPHHDPAEPQTKTWWRALL